mgnify:FL=1
MSTAIIKLSETGDLKRIQDLWLTSGNCAANSNNMETTQLNLSSFWGLFLVTGTASALSLVIYLSRLLWKFSREQSDATDSGNSAPRGKRFIIKSFASYVNESSIGREKKKGSSSSEKKKKKNVAYPQDASTSSEQRSQLQQSSPFSPESPSSSQIAPSDQSQQHHMDSTDPLQCPP